MWILLAVAGVVCLFEAAHRYSNNPKKQLDALYEEARKDRLRKICREYEEYNERRGL